VQWLLKEILLNPVWNIIRQQPVPQNVNEDSWKWRGNTSGLFSFHSTWDVVRQRQDPYQLEIMIWFPSSSPKMAIHYWEHCRTNCWQEFF